MVDLCRHRATAQAAALRVQLLLDAGANLEAHAKNGETHLMLAAGSNENAAVVQLLLDAGADLEARDEAGYTPLMWAARHNESSVVQALLDAGADATATNEDGESAWDLIQENEALEGSPAYWALNDPRFQ